jgi:hypothetical protein
MPSQQISITDMKEMRSFRRTPSVTIVSRKYNKYTAFLRNYNSYVVESMISIFYFPSRSRVKHRMCRKACLSLLHVAGPMCLESNAAAVHTYFWLPVTETRLLGSWLACRRAPHLWLCSAGAMCTEPLNDAEYEIGETCGVDTTDLYIRLYWSLVLTILLHFSKIPGIICWRFCFDGATPLVSTTVFLCSYRELYGQSISLSLLSMLCVHRNEALLPGFWTVTLLWE